ncbi:response regulator receiver and ANTAR domain protein [Nesterenkonia aurantiaca]|uniref:Response regulator receiver and ANTAR domain protein n=1 Tax=Nesterenkonia aurantiaca TaxID=1436010 RepID=A0A4R7G3Q5_9MICC|nr:response regulator receiver and ANTAR domain protein [Nesterenkonia aurantiaca]
MSEQTPGAGESASAAAESRAVPEAAAHEAERGAAPRRVLVAEDETLIRLDIVEILTGAGYDVVGEADNGERAVELARETEPDLVVMDVKMPIMDGITAAQLIAEERIAPVVMLTAFSQRDLVESAREAGAMAYVVKPFTENDLIPAIEVAMARFDEIRALEDEVTSLADKFETRKLVERAKSLLTTKMGLTEPEAFRWIQKTSMDRRLSMREVAETVVDQMTDSPPYLK